MAKEAKKVTGRRAGSTPPVNTSWTCATSSTRSPGRQRKEAIGGTVGVLIIVAVITAVLSLVDVTLAKLVEWVLP